MKLDFGYDENCLQLNSSFFIYFKINLKYARIAIEEFNVFFFRKKTCIMMTPLSDIIIFLSAQHVYCVSTPLQ